MRLSDLFCSNVVIWILCHCSQVTAGLDKYKCTLKSALALSTHAYLVFLQFHTNVGLFVIFLPFMSILKKCQYFCNFQRNFEFKVILAWNRSQLWNLLICQSTSPQLPELILAFYSFISIQQCFYLSPLDPMP